MGNKTKVLISILIICVFVSSISVYGEETKKPLYLEETFPKDSSKDVPLDTEIKLLFNKNVVNFTVKENNSTCFSIIDENNNEIPIDVIFPDDQIEPERKREIIIRPKEAFNENTTYTVKISANLMAKNGNTLGENLSFSFTTIQLTNTETDTNKVEEPEEISSPVDKADPNKEDGAIKGEREIGLENGNGEAVPATLDVTEEKLEELEEKAKEEPDSVNPTENESVSETFSDASVKDDIIEETKSTSTNYLLPVFALIIIIVVIIIIKGKRK